MYKRAVASEFMGKTFQAAQLTHERFLTIDHSCKIFFWYLPNWTSTNLWCVVLYVPMPTGAPGWSSLSVAIGDALTSYVIVQRFELALRSEWIYPLYWHTLWSVKDGAVSSFVKLECFKSWLIVTCRKRTFVQRVKRKRTMLSPVMYCMEHF